MRNALIGTALALAAAAGCSQPADTPSGGAPAASAASASDPVRKSGWWALTSRIGDAQPQVVHTCVDAESEARIGLAPPSAPGDGCSNTAPRRTAAGWEFAISCKLDETTTMQTAGVITGDLGTSYRLDLVSKMTPPPVPGMADSRVRIDGRWLGACPAGRKAGDTVGPNGQLIGQ